MQKNTKNAFRTDYLAVEPRARRLLSALMKEIGELLEANHVSLGVPLEGRVKDWISVQDKVERKSLQVKTASDLDDLVGVRVILLFRSDLSTVIELLRKTFNVLGVEDTASRLGDSQFGYQSQHLILTLPNGWSSIPSLSDLCDLKAEIQVRTVAQHIWAAASHKLQYKQEQSVPPPLRRTISRISALLETVDLELDRVLEERRDYTGRDIRATPPEESLNVDLLAAILSTTFPPENRGVDEDYADLLNDLMHFKIDTVQLLQTMLRKHKESVESEERRYVGQNRTSPHPAGTSKERIEKGVYFSHVGLARMALREEVGEDRLSAFWLEKKKRSTSNSRKKVARKTNSRS